MTSGVRFASLSRSHASMHVLLIVYRPDSFPSTSIAVIVFLELHFYLYDPYFTSVFHTSQYYTCSQYRSPVITTTVSI